MSTLGFTGTQVGPTFEQFKSFCQLLRRLVKHGYREFHHGDCIGADAVAALEATRLGMRLVSHPCNIVSKRAFTPACEIRPVYPPLVRNRHIVNESNVIITMPRGKEVLRGSGTWATIRYARKRQVPVIIVWPCGRIEAERLPDAIRMEV